MTGVFGDFFFCAAVIRQSVTANPGSKNQAPWGECLRPLNAWGKAPMCEFPSNSAPRDSVPGAITANLEADRNHEC